MKTFSFLLLALMHPLCQKRQRVAIGNRPTFDLKAVYANGSKSITNFREGTVRVSIPYTLQNNEEPGNLYAVYVDENGKVSNVPNSSYNTDEKMLQFTTNHFSIYAIAYKSSDRFIGITNHWAKTSNEFVAAHNIMAGTATDTFSPDMPMTRAMFVATLGRMAKIDTNGFTNSKFTDLQPDAYYAPFANWAAEKGIVTGTTNTTFSPDTPISREQMAVMMENFSKEMGYTLPQSIKAVSFANTSDISDYASDAVKAMQQAGILTGRANNRFAPQATATRAEVATTLYQYIKLVVDASTTES